MWIREVPEMRRFLLLYSLVAASAVVLLNGYNVYVDGSTYSHIFKYDFYIVLAESAGFVVLLQWFTYRHMGKWLRVAYGRDRWKEDQTELLERLHRFPSKIFWGTVVYGALLSLGYHTFEIAVFHLRPLNEVVLRHALIELSFAISLALFFYGASRSILRSAVRKLIQADISRLKKSSFLRPMILAYFSMSIVSSIALLWFFINMHELRRLPSGLVLGVILILTALFAFMVFWTLSAGLRRELHTLTEGIVSLTKGNRMELHGRMPIMPYETGELAAAFNGLQERAAQTYEQLDKQLALASLVQQNLLPKTSVLFGGFSVSSYFQPSREVGGDCFDVIPLDERRFAVMIGDVSGKGPPAAVVMSAAIALFRTEIRRGGSPGELLGRLNRFLTEMLKGDMYVTMGIGFFDMENREVRYASAGHVAPYLLRGGTVEQLMLSSLPLGIDLEERFPEISLFMEENDRMVLYTDGVVEDVEDGGEMIGFDGFERKLSVLAGRANVTDLEDQLQLLVDPLGKIGSSPLDDRTIVMVKWSEREPEA